MNFMLDFKIKIILLNNNETLLIEIKDILLRLIKIEIFYNEFAIKNHFEFLKTIYRAREKIF